MRRTGRTPFLPLLILAIVGTMPAAAQVPDRKVVEYQFTDYHRHPRMEREDLLRGRHFQYQPGLEIISDIDGAEVRLFGEKMGRTPWETDNLAAGSYRVSLERTGFELQDFWVTLRNDRRTVVITVMARSTGTLVLHNLPPGAQVSVDREPVEGSELTVDAGRRTLKVTAFGWEPVQSVVEIKPGETVDWTFQGDRSPFVLNSLRTRPASLPSTDPRGFTFLWSATSWGTGTITVDTSDGLRVVDIPFNINAPQGRQSWIPESADTALTDGDYRVVARGMGTDGIVSTAETSLRVDSRFKRNPRMTLGPVPGLAYSPGSMMLPPGIWQLSTSAGFNTGFIDSPGTIGIPVSLSLRFSPAARWETSAKFTIRIEDPFEQTGVGMDVAASWRITPKPGNFSANLALSFTYMGYSSEFSRIPTDLPDLALPGLRLIVPMEYGWGHWSLVFSPGMQLLFLGGDPFNWMMGTPVRTTGETGIGIYYEDERFLAGASAALRSPDAPGAYLDWTLWSGLEGRVNLPGNSSYVSGFCGVRSLDGGPTLNAGVEFGIIG